MHVPVVPSNLTIFSILGHRDAPAGVESVLYRVTERIHDEKKSATDKSVVCKGEKRKNKQTEPKPQGWKDCYAEFCAKNMFDRSLIR